MPHLLFITGKLAEPALRRLLADLGPRAGFESTVAVLPITVAALMTTPWVARHLTVPAGIDRLVLPGWCAGDLAEVQAVAGVPVQRGPKDLRDLPDFFGTQPESPSGYGAHDITILAEINHAPRLTRDELLSQAKALREEGADLIDVGCDPGGPLGPASARPSRRCATPACASPSTASIRSRWRPRSKPAPSWC